MFVKKSGYQKLYRRAITIFNAVRQTKKVSSHFY